MPQKKQKKEKPESQHLNPTVESTMIRVSQILDNFVASKDEGELAMNTHELLFICFTWKYDTSSTCFVKIT